MTQPIPRIALALALCAGAGAVGVWMTWPLPAQMIFDKHQLNACAAEAALESYMENGSKSRQGAEETLAMDRYQNILETAQAYHKRFGMYGLKTIYERWADAAPAICAKHVINGESIVMPNYGVRPGYHITRSPEGSAAIVRDGDPEPVFGCAEEFYATGTPAQPDGSGGCQRR